MKITVLAIGKIREAWLKDGIAEFCRRISKYSGIRIEEIPDVSEEYGIGRSTAEEGRRMLARIRDGEFSVALDVRGRSEDSVGFAGSLARWMEKGGASVTFLVGGSNGLSDEVLARADDSLSLSPMTFPHTIARLVLLEQLFRAFKILGGERYHK